MKTLGYIKEAKEAVAFNSYIRKKLLNFYLGLKNEEYVFVNFDEKLSQNQKASGKNIPPNSMLFNSSKACNFLDDFLEKSTEAKKMVVNDQMMEHHHIFAIGRETLRIQKMLHQHKLAKQVASLNASTPNSVSSPSSTNSSNSNSSNSPPQNNSDEISTPTSSTTSDRTDAGSNNSEESFGSDETRKDDKSPDPPPDIINIDSPSTSKKPALDKLAQFSLELAKKTLIFFDKKGQFHILPSRSMAPRSSQEETPRNTLMPTTRNDSSEAKTC
ncbi:Oidioi.mRNA.OKI2018_I69.chr2.g4109.t1.cds [Oikopleura dioica]|uniref:Oidioi.mRNA.OKI2018_I69.chr2.g4109.t1.cds n=1 Tax=Oikopleura dioica TaxID=34765 RepID=A0ABN7SVX5_OIKDI|nr:Oidioi.mRNA.OKI2018_I69.chr2.g4109.t1.cds [Oikopleura dioica]